MKIAIINGSPRKGNIHTAIQTIVSSAGSRHSFDIIEADKLNISGCKGCGACRCMNGCVADDDTNPTVDRIVAADMIIFATPVYWWGVSSQLKRVLDKCYCRGAQLRGKKTGLIIIGGDDVEGPQYSLINGQFDCIAEYLNWDMVFSKSYSANGINDLAANAAALAELGELGEKL